VEYYVWTWKGAVFCRHDGSDNIISLRSIADIEMLEKDMAAQVSEGGEDSATSYHSDRDPLTTNNKAAEKNPEVEKTTEKSCHNGELQH